ncbi:MAG: hypothetical protein GX263_06045 [Firmicutes bacterium]|nr:hypothetical protein [Bacillota bacterium]
MGWSVVKFKRLEISVHPYFLLFIFLWILAGFPVQTLFLFVLVLGHELTHTLAARAYGLNIHRIELLPFGGAGYLANPLELHPKKELIVAGVGPLFNLVVFIFLLNYSQGLYKFSLFLDRSLINFLLNANFFLFAFNLFPGLPLDGGRVLRALLTPKIGIYRATELTVSSGKLLGALLFVAGLLLACQDYLHLSLSLMGIFLYYAAGREQKTAIYTFLRYLLRKEKALRKNYVLKSEQLVALENTTLLEVLKHFKPGRYHQVIVLNRTCRALDILTESQLLEAALKKGMNITLKGALRK